MSSQNLPEFCRTIKLNPDKMTGLASTKLLTNGIRPISPLVGKEFKRMKLIILQTEN